MTGPPEGEGPFTCVECEDQEASLLCIDCNETFCGPCYQQQHRRGNRTQHKVRRLLGQLMPESAGIAVPVAGGGGSGDGDVGAAVAAAAAGDSKTATADDSESAAPATLTSTAAATKIGGEGEGGGGSGFPAARYSEKVSNIPMRLSDKERDLLRVVEGALRVSEYTDNVDSYRYGKGDIIKRELLEACRTCIGLNACADLKKTAKMVRGELADCEDFLQHVFEVGRRYKIMNPDRMRSTYGKLMYLLQDAADPSHSRTLGFALTRPVLTVKDFLVDHDALALVGDEALAVATAEIRASSSAEAATLTAAKRAAREAVYARHVSDDLSKDDLERVLNSIADSNNYQAAAALPVQRMIEYLIEYVNPHDTSDIDISISYGKGGSKLSHSHKTQFTFVLQTLTLWREITQQMFGLWRCAERDLLTARNYYRLCNTGQGLNRVQSCPAVSKAMHSILDQVQRQCGGWVGLSVVHLGDRDVPNALIFIDKYTQVPRILAPIVQVLDRLEELERDPRTTAFVKQSCGSAERGRRAILQDFFRHGFDGSGSDGGSCIDGRLTSSWNWCSKIEKKSYYPAFLVAGFTSFDGKWEE